MSGFQMVTRILPVLLLLLAAPVSAAKGHGPKGRGPEGHGPKVRTVSDLTLVQTVRTVKPPRTLDGDEAAEHVQILQLHGHVGRSQTFRKVRGPKLSGGSQSRMSLAPEQEIYVDFKRKKVYEINRDLKSYHVTGYKHSGRIKERIHDERFQQIMGLKDGTKIKEKVIDIYDGKEPTREEIIRDHLQPGPFRDKMMRRYGIRETKVVYEVKRTGKTRTICGFVCERLAILADGKATANEAWVTEALRVEADIFTFLEAAELIDSDLVKAMREVGAFPLAYTVRWENGQISRTRTERIGLQKLDSADFKLPPPGYTEQKQKKRKGM